MREIRRGEKFLPLTCERRIEGEDAEERKNSERGEKERGKRRGGEEEERPQRCASPRKKNFVMRRGHRGAPLFFLSFFNIFLL